MNDQCKAIGCRNTATTSMVIDKNLTNLRAKFLPPSVKEKRVRLCGNHSKSIMAEWVKHQG